MNFKFLPGRWSFWLALLGIACGQGTAPAFPPGPDHVLFGMVRDEMGNPLMASNAEITLETLSGVKIKGKLTPGLRAGVNYELVIPMDAGLTSDPYRPTALRPTLGFKLRVRLGSVDYLPIEMRGDYSTLGAPAGRTRIDLTLGEDSDGDGLPDAWERALLAARGGKGTIADIKPGDDTDGDGLTNMQEYLAGTYAFDPKDGFSLTIVKQEGARVTLEFLGIRGRTYRVEATTDLKTWSGVGFRRVSPVADAAVRDQYMETDVRLVRVAVDSPSGGSRLFRLTVE